MEKGHRRGFTLVEVMIVMLLFSMLLLMIFPMRRMAVWVLDHARTQEQAEMLGDAAWRYVADRLETGAVEVEELDGLSMDAFHIDTLKPEIEVEESRSGRVLVTVRVMDGKKRTCMRGMAVCRPEMVLDTIPGSRGSEVQTATHEPSASARGE